MYIAIVALTILVLPVASILVEQALYPGVLLLSLIGRWFVFWGIGVRLLLAGLRQVLQPGFTAREIFHLMTDDAAPIVRELGFSHLAASSVALLSLWQPSFVMPAAIAGCIFFAAAGFIHAASLRRSRNENVAMVSDFFLALVLLGFVGAAWLR